MISCATDVKADMYQRNGSLVKNQQATLVMPEMQDTFQLGAR
jgi:hypothetical protein